MAEPGGGIFTTLRLDGGEPRWWPDHVLRLREAIGPLGLAPFDEVRLRRDAIAAARHCGDPARVRITLLPGRPPAVEARPWAPPGPPWILQPVPASPPGDTIRRKTTRRDYYDRAREAAGGADDALLVDARGRWLECTIANVFLVDGAGRLRTPSDRLPLLPGLARRRVLRAAEALGIAISNEPVTGTEARAARECFVTNALLPVHPVGRIRGVADFASGPVARRLMGALGPAPP